MEMRMKMKNRSHRYNINWPSFCLSIITAACIKQHLSNICSSAYETVKQHTDWAEKKRCLQKKSCMSIYVQLL